ncbi:MAG TPA: hypothetical protein VLV83_19535, partial [Acidobacteriota bacterium]|nr:hypothetical protein [Acidobacteriota bacterium]
MPREKAQGDVHAFAAHRLVTAIPYRREARGPRSYYVACERGQHEDILYAMHARIEGQPPRCRYVLKDNLPLTEAVAMADTRSADCRYFRLSAAIRSISEYLTDVAKRGFGADGQTGFWTIDSDCREDIHSPETTRFLSLQSPSGFSTVALYPTAGVEGVQAVLY